MSLLPTRDRRTRTEIAADRAREVGREVRSSARELAAEARVAAADARPRLEHLGDQAEARWADLRRQLADLDTDQLREDLLGRLEDEAQRAATRAAATSSAVGEALVSLGLDIADLTRDEVDRLTTVIEDRADAARIEVQEAERKKRVKALVGWTAFGIVAGFVLSKKLGGSPQGADAHVELAAEASPEADEVATGERAADGMAADAPDVTAPARR